MTSKTKKSKKKEDLFDYAKGSYYTLASPGGLALRCDRDGLALRFDHDGKSLIANIDGVHVKLPRHHVEELAQVLKHYLSEGGLPIAKPEDKDQEPVRMVLRELAAAQARISKKAEKVSDDWVHATADNLIGDIMSLVESSAGGLLDREGGEG